MEVLVGNKADVNLAVNEGGSDGEQSEKADKAVHADVVAGNGLDGRADGQEREQTEGKAEGDDGGEGLRVPVSLQSFRELVEGELRLAAGLGAQRVQGDEDEGEESHEEEGSDPGEVEVTKEAAQFVAGGFCRGRFPDGLFD